VLAGDISHPPAQIGPFVLAGDLCCPQTFTAGGCKADAPFTIVLAGANYTRQHANFCAPVGPVSLGLVYTGRYIEPPPPRLRSLLFFCLPTMHPALREEELKIHARSILYKVELLMLTSQKYQNKLPEHVIVTPDVMVESIVK
jgi:hypothetical protein